MSRGLENLLSDLVDRRQRLDRYIGFHNGEVDCEYSRSLVELDDIDKQIERVLKLLERG